MKTSDLNVLIVDDVQAIRVHVRELLKGFGFRMVTSAESADEAIQFLEANDFHLILSDWHMAPRTGMDLLNYCRKSTKYKEAAFIMVTAENAKEKVLQAIQAGVDDYIVKPLTIDQIRSKVTLVLLKKRVITI